MYNVYRYVRYEKMPIPQLVKGFDTVIEAMNYLKRSNLPLADIINEDTAEVLVSTDAQGDFSYVAIR